MSVGILTPDLSWMSVGKNVKCVRPMTLNLLDGTQRETEAGEKAHIFDTDGHHVSFELDDGRSGFDLEPGENCFTMLAGDFEYFWEEDGPQEMMLLEVPMIRDRHPDQRDGKGLKYLGYWYRIGGDGWPNPADFVDESWDAAERAKVAAYLRAGERVHHWMGFSWCRFKCGEDVPGTCCLSDGEYVWPEGFVHYIEKHSVKPPDEFIQKALGG